MYNLQYVTIDAPSGMDLALSPAVRNRTVRTKRSTHYGHGKGYICSQ